MASSLDKARSSIAVTGIGIITSLGIGKADNWRKLTAGQSGIRGITRFPTDALRTTIGGTIDFIPIEPFCSTALTERLAETAVEEAVAESRIGRAADFPGPLFLAVAPAETEWSHRQSVCSGVRVNGTVR